MAAISLHTREARKIPGVVGGPGNPTRNQRAQDDPGDPRRPQELPEGPRRPQEAPGAPSGGPPVVPKRPRNHRRLQITAGGPRRPKEVPGSPRMPQECWSVCPLCRAGAPVSGAVPECLPWAPIRCACDSSFLCCAEVFYVREQTSPHVLCGFTNPSLSVGFNMRCPAKFGLDFRVKFPEHAV
jgi:hypothetical protein